MAALSGPNIIDVAELLSDAAIDWRFYGDGSIYITSLDFNIWVQPMPDRSGLEFFTYWPFCSDVSTHDALSYVNECNLDLPMVQFSFSACASKLQGHYVLYVPDEVDRRCFVRSARKFAEIFAAAMKRDANCLLVTKDGSRRDWPLTISSELAG